LVRNNDDIILGSMVSHLVMFQPIVSTLFH
jgi:hypothetical protein